MRTCLSHSAPRFSKPEGMLHSGKFVTRAEMTLFPELRQRGKVVLRVPEPSFAHYAIHLEDVAISVRLWR